MLEFEYLLYGLFFQKNLNDGAWVSYSCGFDDDPIKLIPLFVRFIQHIDQFMC